MPVTVQRLFLYNPYSEDEPWCAELSGNAAIGVDWGGIAALMRLLENHGGFGGEEITRAELLLGAVEYIRAAVARGDASGIAESFAADAWGTAQTLLAWRRTLRLAGWNGASAVLPERLRTLLSVFDSGSFTMRDLPERIDTAIARIGSGASVPLARVVLWYPERRPLIRRLLDALAARGCTVELWAGPAQRADTAAIARVAQLLETAAAGASPQQKETLAADDSLQFVQARNRSEAAEATALFLQNTPGAGGVLIAEGDTVDVLMQTLASRGVAVPGAASRSGGDVLDQFVPLFCNAITREYHAQRFLEYLLLPLSPLPAALRYALAREFARRPGRGGETWNAIIEKHTAADDDAAARVRCFLPRPDELVERQAIPCAWFREAMSAYRLWLNGLAHAADRESLRDAAGAAMARVQHLCAALALHPSEHCTADDIINLWQQLSAGERGATCREAGSVFPVSGPFLINGSADTVIWWDFAATDARPESSFITAAERAALNAAGIIPDTPAQLADDVATSLRRMVSAARRLICIRIDPGAESPPHPLMNILAGLVDEQSLRAMTKTAAECIADPYRRIIAPVIPVHSATVHCLDAYPAGLLVGEGISVSDLESLIRCPFRFALERITGCRNDRTAVIAGDNATGTVLHEFLEHCVEQGMPQQPEQLLGSLIARGNAALNQDDQRMARDRLVLQAVRCADTLTAFVRDNGLHAVVMEEECAGIALADGTPVRGRIDFNAESPQGAIVLDMKYSERANYGNRIRENTAFQIVLYQRMKQAAYAGYVDIRTASLAMLGNDGPLEGVTWCGGDAVGMLDAFLSAAEDRLRALAGGEWRAPWNVSKNVVEIDEYDQRVILKPYCDSCGYAALCGKSTGNGASDED